MLMLIGIEFITVMAIVTSEYNYVDVAIAMALVGFLATVAFARYIYRRAHITDADELEEVDEITDYSEADPGTNAEKGNV